MRSRPKVEVRLLPGKVSPGQTFEVIATFDSRTRTPIEVVEFQFTGPLYRPILNAAYFGNAVRLVARHAPKEFAAGRHEVRARFAVPSHVPPSYVSPGFCIEYLLTLHVDIPWWPDVLKRYVVPVALPPSAAREPRPGVFCTDSRGPHDRALYAEASLDDVVVEPGGVVTGAVSFNNTSFHRIRGVSVAFVSRIGTGVAAGGWETQRYVAPVCSGAPPESEAVPFRVRVPVDAMPEFKTPRGGISWQLEVAVDAGRSHSVLLAIPIRVIPPTAGGPRTASIASTAPSVGRERRMRLWSTVAQQLGMQYDNTGETLRFARGPLNGIITLELRGDGLMLCATLSWPSLGLDLDVGPAQWTDRFAKEEIEIGEATFDAGFRVRGRSREQVLAVLSPAVRAGLLGARDARLDDAGLHFAIADAGLDLPHLMAFATHAASVLADLETAFASVSPPAPLASHRQAWSRFAERLGGRLEIGRMWIHGGSFGTEPVEVGTQWKRTGEFDATVIRVRFEQPLERSYDPGESDTGVDATRTLARELAKDARFIEFGPDAVTVELEELFSDPARLEPYLDRAARLVRRLSGRSDAGPYR